MNSNYFFIYTRERKKLSRCVTIMDEYDKIKKSDFILIKELIPYEEEHGI